MGANSSTLQSIESLNSTLSDIERKLGVVEDVHLHHERTICQDESVLVSGKLIRCRADVSLICGPIVGLIGHDFARILIESDGATDITINCFSIDEITTDSRFCFEESISVQAGIPIAHTIRNLCPSLRYAVYVGGVNSTDTLLHYATFLTLPVDDRSIKFAFIHSGKVESIYPGEVNLINVLETAISRSNDLAPRMIEGQSDKHKTRQVEHTHIIIHNGDFVSVDETLRTRALTILDLLLREDYGADSWASLLEETEVALKEVYRSALANPSIRTILRRCGNVFVAGQGEAAAVTASLLSMGPPPPPPPPPESPKKAVASSAAGSKMSVKERRAAAKAQESAKEGERRA